MKIYVLKKQQLIGTSIDKAWKFFSDPMNLARITPGYMGFEVMGKHEEPIYEGMIIRYTVKPLWDLKIDWVTEITHVEHEKRFVDEQRFGPYKFWHHQHQFKPHPKGVLMEDLLHYGLGFWWVGRAMNQLLIHKKLEEIFAFREKAVEQIFI